MKTFENIVRPLPNADQIRNRILRAAITTFGKRTQDSLDERSAKKARTTGQVVLSSTVKNWSSNIVSNPSPAVFTSTPLRAKRSKPVEQNNNQSALNQN